MKNLLKWCGFALSLLILLGGIVYGYGSLNSRVDSLEGVSAETKEVTHNNELVIVEINTKLTTISEDIKEIKQEIKELK